MKSRLKSEIPDIAIAVSLAAFLSVVLPVQTYLLNVSLFAFTPARMALESGILFLGLALGLWLVLATVGRFLGGVLQALFVALLLCAYLESGILSAGLPEINGGFLPALAVRSRALVDLAVWSCVLVGFLATVRWIRPWLHWVALAILAVSICSIFDVRRAQTPSPSAVADGGLTSGFEWQRDIIENFRYSPKRNMLVFILDSMPGNLSYDFVRSDPSLRGKFAGFTAFTNNASMHNCTKYGLPALMTGRYFEPGVSSAADYPVTIFGEESFLMPYVRDGSQVFFVDDLMPYGYTNAKVEKRAPIKARQNHDWSAFLRRSREIPYLSLFNTAVFRLTPYCGKAPFLYSKIRKGVARDSGDLVFWYEHVMFPILAKAPLSDAATTLGVFHSHGAHPPLVFDPEGRLYPGPKLGPDTVRELVSTPIRHLSRLMDALRERGLYDKSFIVIAADHGNIHAPFAKGHHPTESAILWVKPEGATGPFAAVARPTGYSKVSVLLREAEKGPVAIETVGRILEERNRLFRYEEGHAFCEYTVGPNGEVL